MPTYAAETSVSSEASRMEIERTLIRYKADEFAYATSRNQAKVGFVLHDRQVRFTLAMPDRQAREFTHTPHRGSARTQRAASEAYEQAVRQRWRALALVIKAKLEAVEAGIVTFEEEFAMHMVLPGGDTLGDLVIPQIEQAYASGKVPALMPGKKG